MSFFFFDCIYYKKLCLKNENLHNVYTNDSEAPRAIENEQRRNEKKKHTHNIMQHIGISKLSRG